MSKIGRWQNCQAVHNTLWKKINIDTAIASSVFGTTITDVIGFLSFLGLGAYFFYG